MSFQPIEEVLRQKEKFCIIKTVVRDDPEITVLYIEDETDILPILKEEEKYIDKSCSYSRVETDFDSKTLEIRTIRIYVCFTNFLNEQYKIFYTIVSPNPFSNEIYEEIDDLARNWNIYQ